LVSRAGGLWNITTNDQLQLSGQTLFRGNSHAVDYLLYPAEWRSQVGRKNTALHISYTHSYKYTKGAGYFSLSARTPVFSDYFNYNYAEFESVNTHILHRLLLRTRLYARYGSGSNIPYESALFLAGANPEEMMDNKYVRSMAFVPDSWRNFSRYETNHFHYGGGLNMRGYAGYYAFDQREGNQYVSYKGRSGAALNLELDFTNYINWKPALTRNWLSANLYVSAMQVSWS
jgi:hypothetical protein